MGLELSRRTFVKSVSAAGAFLLLPGLRIRPSYDLHGMLGTFVAKNDDVWAARRYDLTAPYVMEDHAYATDGKIMGRIVTLDADTDPVSRRIPRETVDVWERSFSEDGHWQPLPDIRIPDDQFLCSECYEDTIECPHCDGNGEVYNGDYPFSADHCEHCNGRGSLYNKACPRCHGEPWKFGEVNVVGYKLIAPHYHRRLAAIPGVMVNLGKSEKDEPIRWKSDIGIEGLCMPVARR